MGIDFISKCTPSFERSWDQNWAKLQGPDLFRQHPQVQGRTYRLNPDEGASLKNGEQILLRMHEDRLVAFRGRTRLGVVANPPAPLSEAVQKSCGSVCAQVQCVHPRSGAADISIVP